MSLSQFDPEQTSDAFFGLCFHGSYPRDGWGDSISGRNVDREGAAMNQPETGEAPEAVHGRLDLQKELAEVLRQRAAISEVLRAIAGAPHDLQPIFDTILDSAVHLCRAELGVLRLVEEAGFRLVAIKMGSLLAEYAPPMLYEHGSFMGRLFASKSPVHIPDFEADVHLAGEADRVPIAKKGLRTTLFVPMLRNDKLIGSM